MGTVNNISSTLIRKGISSGQSVQFLLPQPTLEYIKKIGAYKTPPPYTGVTLPAPESSVPDMDEQKLLQKVQEFQWSSEALQQIKAFAEKQLQSQTEEATASEDTPAAGPEA